MVSRRVDVTGGGGDFVVSRHHGDDLVEDGRHEGEGKWSLGGRTSLGQ